MYSAYPSASSENETPSLPFRSRHRASTKEAAGMTKAAAQCAARPSRSYFDLHDQLAALEKAGLLLKVDIPVKRTRRSIR